MIVQFYVCGRASARQHGGCLGKELRGIEQRGQTYTHTEPEVVGIVGKHLCGGVKALNMRCLAIGEAAERCRKGRQKPPLALAERDAVARLALLLEHEEVQTLRLRSVKA